MKILMILMVFFMAISFVNADSYKVELVSTGHQFTEGPIWTPWGTLIFSDLPSSKILEYGTKTLTYRSSSNSNGMTLDHEGRLIICEHTARRVTRIEKNGSVTILADTYDGKRLNSPNDVVVKSDGSIYFTDPTYGISSEQQELAFKGVYRITPDGKLELLVKDFDMPNGLCFSPDESKLYIADSSDLRHIRVFKVGKDGTLSDGKVFAKITSNDGVPDGMKIDLKGNLYVAGPGGAWVFDTTGKHIGTIKCPETPANLAWGNDGKTLYMTAVTSVYKVRLNIGGKLCFSATAIKKRPEAKMKPILSCDTYSLRDYFGQGKLDYITVPKTLKEIGISGVTYNDIWMKSYDTPYLDEIKKACADAGVKVTGFICEGNLATLDDNAWNAQIADDEKKMRAASYLGAPVVRLNLGGLGDEEKDDTIGADRCIAAFKKLITLAKELNMKMTIENHGGVSKKADTIIKVIKGSDPEWVGACLDFGNWPDNLRNSESAKLVPYAYHIHAKTNNFNEQGEDINKDYGYFIRLLKDSGYNRAVSIEYEGNEDQIEGVKNTRNLILKYWPELVK